MGQTAAVNGLPAASEWRRTIEERLRETGVPQRLAPPEGRLGEGERHAERLRAALEALGPIFASFGLYLASRLDLLSRRDAIELGKIRTWSAPSSPMAVAALIRREFGAMPADCFLAFEPEPIAADLLFQTHAAWLAPDLPVAVRIVRPEIAELIDRDVPLLAALEPHLALSPGRLGEALDDFALLLQRRVDQLGQADSLWKLTLDARSIGGLDAPICYRERCSPSVLTTERVDGVRLAYAFREGAPASTLVGSADRESTVRRLCAAWLRQATEGRVIPTDMGPHDVVLLPNRMVYVGSGFEPQTAEGRERFLSYINAAGVDDPDGACDSVVAECESRREEGAYDQLKRRFRQAVPFRDGESNGEDNLAEQLLVHWRVTAESGWRLRPHLLHIYQAVQSLAQCTESVAPGRDVLTLAFQDVRLRIGLNGAQQLMNPLAMPATLDKLLANMVNLPQKLDEILTLAAEGRIRLTLNLPANQEQRRIRNSTVSLIAGLSVMVSLVFLFRLLIPQPGVVVERFGTVVLVVAGLWLLNSARSL